MIAARQRIKISDLREQLKVHSKLFERQARELSEKDRSLLTARIIAVVAVVAQLITLYQWLVVPALGCYR